MTFNEKQLQLFQERGRGVMTGRLISKLPKDRSTAELKQIIKEETG